jgi:phenylpropionate dioxygenase-like ring-hydroxylating dioxygenase large terminal subunit
MPSFLNDQAVAERILSHVRNGTTDAGNEVWREPVQNYRSEERFRREIEVLRRSAVPFCPSAALPEPGSYIGRNAAGIPILVVRGEDGRVRAFRNACRHRGTEVAQGAGCAKGFVCPYHGWAYRLDGRLQHVPHEHGFPGFEKNENGLVPVLAEERAGLVFVNQSGEANEHDPSQGLDELISPELELIDTHNTEAQVNWKVALEGSIEGYHIRFGHRETFYPYGYDNLNVIETSGRDSRVTFPFRRIEKLADVPSAERRVEGRLTYIYHLFPNALVAVLSHHRNLVVLEPLDVGRTMMIAYSLADTGGDPVAAESARRDAEFVNQTGATEDLALIESVQRSIGSEANEFFTFGHFESAIIHFHRNLQKSLEELD